MKILDFKTASPLFEMERDGFKPFTIRKIDKDARFSDLEQWMAHYNWGIRITNPATGECFVRQLEYVDTLWFVGFEDWQFIELGNKC